MCAARKAMDGGRDPPLEEGGPPGVAVATADNRDEVVDRLNKAKGRYEAALVVKPDFHDATIALAQRRYERARLLCAAAGLSGAGESPAKGNGDSDEAEAEFSGACADFDAVLAILPEDPPKPPEPVEKKEPEQEKKEGEEEEAEQPSMRAQVQVMWGNTLFEQSQMRARLGKEWRPLLDVAVEQRDLLENLQREDLKRGAGRAHVGGGPQEAEAAAWLEAKRAAEEAEEAGETGEA